MNRRLPVLTVLALFLLVGITYLPALHNGFIWDDDAHLTANPAITSPNGLRRIWTSFVLPVYYPVTFSGFWMMYQMWGQNALPYHATTLGLHAANSVLLFFVLRRLKIRAAWMIAAVWAVHPVNVESVAWVTESKNTLSGLFFFLTLLCYFSFECRTAFPGGTGSVARGSVLLQTHSPHGKVDAAPEDSVNVTRAGRRDYTAWYAMSLVCFTFALLSKTSTAVLPALILLCAWWQRGHVTRADLLRSAPFFLLSLAASLVAIWAQMREAMSEGAARDWSLTWPERLVVSGKDVWFYASKILWPQKLIFIYPRWSHDDLALTEWLPLLGAVIVGTLLWQWRHTNRGRASLFGIGCFVVALSPVLGLFDQYLYAYSFVADHFQYLASAGLIALVVIGAAVVLRGRFAQRFAAVAALAVLTPLSWRHSKVFSDPETLWRDTLAKNPNAAIAYNNLGALLNSQKHFEEAIQYFRKALQLRPNTAEPHSNLGIALTKLGRYDEALYHFREALATKPESAAGHYHLAVLCAKMNRLDDAEQNYLLAIRYDRYHFLPEACFELGLVWERQGKRAQAAVAYGDALRIKPDYAFAHNNLANLLAEDGKLDEAIDHYRRAVAADPKLETAHHNLATLLRRTGDLNGAIQHLRIAVDLEPGRADTRLELGQALIAAGRHGEAIEVFRQGLEAQPENVALGNALAWLLATCPEAQLRDGKKAVQIGERVVELTNRKLPQVLDTLAAAYAEAGRFDEAMATEHDALALAQSTTDTNLVSEIAGRSMLFERRQPYRLGATSF
jgi:tetratricopeptide (TPR) repeat protein